MGACRGVGERGQGQRQGQRQGRRRKQTRRQEHCQGETKMGTQMETHRETSSESEQLTEKESESGTKRQIDGETAKQRCRDKQTDQRHNVRIKKLQSLCMPVSLSSWCKPTS